MVFVPHRLAYFKTHNLFCWHHLPSLCDSCTTVWSYHWLLFIFCLDTKHRCIPSLAVGTSKISFVFFSGTWDAPHLLLSSASSCSFNDTILPRNLSDLRIFFHYINLVDFLYPRSISPGFVPAPMRGLCFWGQPWALYSLAQDAHKMWPKWESWIQGRKGQTRDLTEDTWDRKS